MYMHVTPKPVAPKRGTISAKAQKVAQSISPKAVVSMVGPWIGPGSSEVDGGKPLGVARQLDAVSFNSGCYWIHVGIGRQIFGVNLRMKPP